MQESPRSSPPPSIFPRSLDLIFAADPYDPRFISLGAGRCLTPLGAVVNAWYWLKSNPMTDTPLFAPMRATFLAVMKRECPDTLQELEKHLEQRTP